MGMLLSILQIVVIPIALGLVIHHLFPRVVKAVEPYLPAFSMVCIWRLSALLWQVLRRT